MHQKRPAPTEGCPLRLAPIVITPFIWELLSILSINRRYSTGLIPLPDPAAPPKEAATSRSLPSTWASLASLSSPGTVTTRRQGERLPSQVTALADAGRGGLLRFGSRPRLESGPALLGALACVLPRIVQGLSQILSEESFLSDGMFL